MFSDGVIITFIICLALIIISYIEYLKKKK